MALLPIETFRMLPPVAVGAPTIAGILAAIQTALALNAYFDGEARVPGQGRAVEVETAEDDGGGNITALVLRFAHADAQNGRVILAGLDAGSAGVAPVMYGLNTKGDGRLLAGAFKEVAEDYDGTTFAGWDAAEPIPDAEFTGYVRGITLSVKAPVAVRIMEAAEGIQIGIEDVDGNMWWIDGGARVDPRSENALDCETDGRLWAISTSGGVTAFSTTMWTGNTGEDKIWGHQTADGRCHSVGWKPRTATKVPLLRYGSSGAVTVPAAQLVIANWRGESAGVYERVPIPIIRDEAVDKWHGRLRGMFIIWIATSGQKLRVSGGGAYLGYIGSRSVLAANEAWLVQHSS